MNVRFIIPTIDLPTVKIGLVQRVSNKAMRTWFLKNNSVKDEPILVIFWYTEFRRNVTSNDYERIHLTVKRI